MFSGITQWINDLQTDPSGTLITLAYIAVAILFSLILHECAHGWVAYKCGDPTAKMLGRLTLNPMKHLDPLGTICMVFLRFGWAKPVPVNPRNFKHYRRDYILVSMAGIVTNLLLCIVGMILYSILCKFVFQPELLSDLRRQGLQNNLTNLYKMMIPYSIYTGEFDNYIIRATIISDYSWILYIQRFLLMVAQMNLMLAIFNLLPVPPLDGFRLVDMFIFKGRLALDRSVVNIIQMVFFVVCFSGLLSGVLGTVNSFVFEQLCNVVSVII